MKIKLYLILSAALLTLSTMPLFSWGLLQGRTTATIVNEKEQYYKGLYRTFDPFYAGPLLAPSAYVVPRGYFNVQPYFFWRRNWGVYDSGWNKIRTRSSLQFKFLSVFQAGLTDFMEITSTVVAVLNRKQDQHYFGYGDTSAALAFQLTEGIMGTPMPACKLQIGVVFPTGKHDRLVESRVGVDSIGAGCYGTSFSLNFQKNFNSIFKKNKDPRYYHPFRFRWSFGYLINSKTRVKGLNAYGGSRDAHGMVKVGNSFISILAWEFSFTQHWVFATDWQYLLNSPSKFSGNNGGTKIGTSSNQNWSVAPALEYNLNSNFGALIGAWFSFAGRNSSGFVTGIASFTYLF